MAGYRKACRGQEIVAPPFAKVGCQRERGATISCPSLFERTKMVLFLNLLLTHIAYPTLTRTPYQAWQANGKNSGLPLHPLPLFGEKENATASSALAAACLDRQRY